MKKSTARKGQPKKVITRKAVRLTLLPEIREQAAKVAFKRRKSLSRIVEDALVEIIKEATMA